MDNNQVKDINPSVFVDLFGDSGTSKSVTPKFGMQEGMEVNLFSTTEETTKPSTTEETTQSTTEETTKAPVGTEADILGGGVPPVSIGKKPELDGLSSYFQDRLKSGKFVAITMDGEDGKPTQFVPKTAEEFDEVVDLQINFRLEQELAKQKEALQKTWYESKSPAWKVVAEYAEMVDDPAEILPFIQGIRTIQSVNQLNENEIEGAEQIVRTRMEQRGDPEETIVSQIEALKTTDKLLPTAKQYKPVILQQEQVALQQQVQLQREQEQLYVQEITDVRDNVIKSLEQPIFGKQKLRQEEKAAIYDLIGMPAEETQGYGIYSAIDSLFDKRDSESMEMLKQIALLLSKKDSFFSYLGTSVANNTAASLQSKLRVAAEAKTAGKDSEGNDKPPVINRSQFTHNPRFGR